MSMHTRAIAALSLAGLVGSGALPSHAVDTGTADTITRMMGRWSGDAQLVPTSGPSRKYKCVVTYRGAGDGTRVAQNLRCSSDDYKLEAATLLSINGSEVTGRWEDRVNSLGGDVRGTVTSDGFDVHLGGRFFEAKMQVAGSGCTQLVKLTPVRADYIRELSANLRKC